MIKKLRLSTLLLLLMCILAVSCSLQEELFEPRLDERCMTDVDEARQYLSSLGDIQYGPSSSTCFPTGTFAPIWSDAEAIFNEYTGDSYLEVPFISSNTFRFFRCESRSAVLCNAERKLLIKKRTDGEMFAYVLWIVAEPEYTRKNADVDILYAMHNDGRYSNFSGLYIYTTLSGHVVRVNRIEDGILVDGVFMRGCKSAEQRNLLYEEYKRICGNLSVVKGFALQTRSASEPDDSSSIDGGVIDSAVVTDSIVYPGIPDADFPYLPGNPLDGAGNEGSGDDDDPTGGDGGGGGGGPTGGGHGNHGDGSGNDNGNNNSGDNNNENNNNGPGTSSHPQLPQDIDCFTIVAPTESLAEKVREEMRTHFQMPAVPALYSLSVKEIRLEVMEHGALYVRGQSYIRVNMNDIRECAIHEDLWHSIQYLYNPGMTDGQMELEAKILLSLMQERGNVYYGLYREHVGPMLEFYDNPTADTFEAAVECLNARWDYGLGCFSVSGPDDGDYTSLFANITTFINQFNLSFPVEN